MAEPDEPTIETYDRLARLAEVFRPSGPIDHQDLFSGRVDQLIAVTNVMVEVGRHAVIFGERGVGKTSLAVVSGDLRRNQSWSIRVNCDQADTFESIWTKVVDEVAAQTYSMRWPFGGEGKAVTQRATELLTFDDITPDRVRHFLRILSELKPVVVFLDEFDRVLAADIRALLADTIKTLSDQLVAATVIVVGVADDVDGLIAEHHSIERAIAQIRMPRMTADEIRGIYDNGFNAVDLSVPPELLDDLTLLPQGLPHFAHLLGLEAATPAILEDRDSLLRADIKVAVRTAVDNADESLTRCYVEATTSAHSGTLYDSVLLASALAPVDQLGFFAPGDLREPLRRLTGENYEIPRFARHLVQFCTERGPVLERRGGEHRWRYRFINPMMRPYIVMRAAMAGTDQRILGLVIDPQPSEPAPPS